MGFAARIPPTIPSTPPNKRDPIRPPSPQVPPRSGAGTPLSHFMLPGDHASTEQTQSHHTRVCVRGDLQRWPSPGTPPLLPTPARSPRGGLAFNLPFPHEGKFWAQGSLRSRTAAKGFSSPCSFNLPGFRSGEQYRPFISPGPCATSQL